jgi:hypothetical protein
MKVFSVILSLLGVALAANSYTAGSETSVAKLTVAPEAANVNWNMIQFAGLNCGGGVEASFVGADASGCIPFAGTVGAQSFIFNGDGILMEVFLDAGCQVPLQIFEDVDGICFSLNPGAAAAHSFAVLN